MKKSGSYLEDDVIFLLKEIAIESTEIEEKEKKIQSGKSHYSELITFEKPPTPLYMDIFYNSFDRNKIKFSQDLIILANEILNNYSNQEEIIIVSLARAGTPIGVILKRFLQTITNKKIHHYCVSIIRDLGIDSNALTYILSKHNDSSLVFVDGWTGKGIIGEQLKSSITSFNKINNCHISSNLYVLLDISGTAFYGASHNDYLIPSSVLNSTISGLISRTIVTKDNTTIHNDNFHGCVYYANLENYDISQWFVDETLKCMKNLKLIPKENSKYNLFENSINTLKFFKNYLSINNINYIKPGIGEATRVMLRRVPQELWIKDISNTDIEHLVFLAKEKNIPIVVNDNLTYNAVAIIKELD
jgi:hypothetical protein